MVDKAKDMPQGCGIHMDDIRYWRVYPSDSRKNSNWFCASDRTCGDTDRRSKFMCYCQECYEKWFVW